MELTKWIEATNHYMDTFEFKYGVTPFSEWHWPVYASVLYLITIFGLKYALPFQLTLKYPQALHNLILSVGSFVVLSGLLFDLAMAMLNENATPNDLFCDPNGRYYKGRVAFWVWIFHLSKFYEFIDTVFIALKKKPLDFLHVYHHILTLFATWLGLLTNTTFQWIGVVTNTLVHTVMYYYYLRTTLDPNARIWWKKHLTQMQITQFYFNLAVLALWLVVNSQQNCSGSVTIVGVTIFANATFNLLFNRFFSRTYTKKDGKGEANGAAKIKKDK